MRSVDLSRVFRAAMHVSFAQECLVHAGETDVPDVAFTASVDKAISDCKVPAGSFCSEFGVTQATVSRWRTGDARPGAYMRRDVLKWIARTVDANAPVVPGGRKRVKALIAGTRAAQVA